MESENYRDYVIKDGKFIGDFENMYKNSKDVPWHQDITSESINTDVDMTLLRHLTKKLGINSIAEVGCGEGYVAQRIYSELGVKVDGYDISKTAIEKAKSLHEDINFFVVDFTENASMDTTVKYDVLFIKNIFWYVLDDLELFMRNIKLLLNKNGAIYINQSVPDLEQFYGSDLFPTTFSFIDYFNLHFKEVYSSSTYEMDILSTTVTYSKSKQVRYFGTI